MLSPSVVPVTTNSDGKYIWNSIDINIKAIKIQGAESTEVNILEDDTLKVYCDNSGQETELPSTTYTVPASSSEGEERLVPFGIVLKKNDVPVDIQTVSFSTKGADGEKGDKGDPGEKGDPGDPGQSGKSASLRMMGKWQSSVQYYYQQEDGGILYTDVVSHESNGVLKFYQAKQSSLGQNPSSSVEYWQEIAFSEVTLTQQLLITSDSGGITGGFVDVEKAEENSLSDDGIILWAGSPESDTSVQSANNATFSVTRSGVIRAKEGLFEGMYAPKEKEITSTSLVLSKFIDLKQAVSDSYDEQSYLHIPKFIDFSTLSEVTWFNLDDYIYATNDSEIQDQPVVGTIDLGGTLYNLIQPGRLTLKLPTGIMLPEYNLGGTIDEKWTAMIKYFQVTMCNTSHEDFTFEGGEDFTWGTRHHFYTEYLGAPSIQYDNTTINEVLHLQESTAFVENHREFLLQEFLNAMPYVGKTFTLINFKGTIQGILEKEEGGVEYSGFNRKLGAYLSDGIGSQIDVNTSSLFQVKCSLQCFGDDDSWSSSLKGGYYIYWEMLNNSADFFTLPNKNKQSILPTLN